MSASAAVQQTRLQQQQQQQRQQQQPGGSSSSSSYKVVEAGRSNLSLRCSVFGIPSASVSWWLDNRLVANNSRLEHKWERQFYEILEHRANSHQVRSKIRETGFSCSSELNEASPNFLCVATRLDVRKLEATAVLKREMQKWFQLQFWGEWGAAVQEVCCNLAGCAKVGSNTILGAVFLITWGVCLATLVEARVCY